MTTLGLETVTASRGIWLGILTLSRLHSLAGAPWTKIFGSIQLRSGALHRVRSAMRGGIFCEVQLLRVGTLRSQRRFQLMKESGSSSGQSFSTFPPILIWQTQTRIRRAPTSDACW